MPIILIKVHLLFFVPNIPEGRRTIFGTIITIYGKIEGGTMASGNVLRRLKRELNDCVDPNGAITAQPANEQDMFYWKGTIKGPEGTPYEGGIFHLDIHFPVDYPFKPPRVSFVTKVYHTNISAVGGVCLDILKDAWSPALTIMKVPKSTF
jgi:ubiquitin-protein ligase